MVYVVMLLKFKGAKSRLSPFLSQSQRIALTGICAAHVLKCSKHYPVIIVSPESIGNTYGENENINAGISLLRQSVNDDMLILTSDLPLLTPACIDSLVNGGDTVVIALSHNGGTSGIYIPKGVEFETSFGPDSASVHMEKALKDGLKVKIIENDCFHDIDTLQDIFWARDMNVEVGEYLERIGIIFDV